MKDKLRTVFKNNPFYFTIHRSNFLDHTTNHEIFYIVIIIDSKINSFK